MKFGSPLPHKKARIEIIPLIDIMFFLLASFLMASLTMIRVQSVKLDLPTATTASKDFKPDLINIAVRRNGDVYVEKDLVTMIQLQTLVSNKFRANTNVPVYLSADRDTKHGLVTKVLDVVRREGIQKVSFAVSPPSAKQP